MGIRCRALWIRRRPVDRPTTRSRCGMHRGLCARRARRNPVSCRYNAGSSPETRRVGRATGTSSAGNTTLLRPPGYNYTVTGLPTLVVISGPMGSGKTTLAHRIARKVGCPAVCRDEIKEGMVHATPGFVAGSGDELTMRTLPTFFAVLELLLRAGVTTVAEAAFQDRVWRPRLEPFRGLARLRIVHCTVDAELAFARSIRRHREKPLRRAHADPEPADAVDHALTHHAFKRVTMDAPWMEVDTTEGYRPGLDEIVAFATSRTPPPAFG